MTNKAKEKVAAKVGKAKDKIAKKCAKTAKALLLALAFAGVLCGCATSEPASRATCARYDFGDIKVDNGSTLTLTLGDGAIASADSTGSTETMTANPTNDVKPQTEVAVGVGGSSAGVGGTGGVPKQGVGAALGAAVDAGLGTFVGDGATDEKSAAPAKGVNAATECADGSCEIPCEDCEL